MLLIPRENVSLIPLKPVAVVSTDSVGSNNFVVISVLQNIFSYHRSAWLNFKF